MVKGPRMHKSFSLAFYFKCFLKLFFFSCLSIACTNIWLGIHFGILKNWKLFFKKFLIKMALSKIDSFNFGNS
jgi:hypothetical protein